MMILAKQIDMSEGFFFDEENEYWISKKVGFDVEFELRGCHFSTWYDSTLCVKLSILFWHIRGEKYVIISNKLSAHFL